MFPHDVGSWPIPTFRCAAEFGRYRGIAYGAEAPLYAADRIVQTQPDLEPRFLARHKLPGLMPIKP